MSIILNGITSDGTSVPIEVTADGKLVVDTSGIDGLIKQGDDIQAGSITADDITANGDLTTTGTLSVPSPYVFNVDSDQAALNETNLTVKRKQGSTDSAIRVTRFDGSVAKDVVDINADGSIATSGPISPGNSGQGIALVTVAGETGGCLHSTNQTDISTARTGNIGSAIQPWENAYFAGSIHAAEAKCGFTSSGELFFTSRNDRWKAVVQGGNVMAEPYTRATELQEKAAKLREPRTQDIVSED